MKPQAPQAPRKFTFDQRFDAGATQRAAAPRAKRFYTPEEVEAVKVEAYERGRGSLEAITAQAQSLALGQIAEATMAALGALDDAVADARAEALRMGLAAAQRIAGAALDHYPLATLEETIAHCLAQAAHEPRVVIRVGGEMVDVIKARIETLTDTVGFAGRVVVSAEPRLARADCRLEWSDGGVERDARVIGERITAALERFIDNDRRRAEQEIGA